MSSVPIAFEGELMLAGWRDSHTGGATVTFWLPDAADLERFRHMTIRKGNKAGQRLAAVLVLIGDDEKPVPVADQWTPAERAAMEARGAEPLQFNAIRGGEIAKWMGIQSANTTFQEFLRRQYDLHLGGDGSGYGDLDPERYSMAELMKHFALVLCECEKSRAEIDNDPRKRELWRERIRTPWVEYQRAIEAIEK